MSYLHAQSKRNNTMRRGLTAIPLLLLSTIGYTQVDTSASAVYQPAVANAIRVYQQFRGDESNLYNGPVVEQSNFSGKGNPYYDGNDWFNGTVIYGGELYENVSLKYDLVRDQLVVLAPNTRTAFYLFKPRVASFTLGDRTFANFKKVAKSSLAEGYYQVLAKGAITVLQKSSKSLRESLSTAGIEQRYDEKTRFYAMKDGVYHDVSSAKDLYALTGSFKASVKDEVEKQGGNNKTLEEALRAIAKSYNQRNP